MNKRKYYKASTAEKTFGRPGYLTSDINYAAFYVEAYLDVKKPEMWCYIYEFDIDLDSLQPIDCDMHLGDFGPNLSMADAEKIMPGFYCTGEITHTETGDKYDVIMINEPMVWKIKAAYKGSLNFDENANDLPDSNLARDKKTGIYTTDDMLKDRIHRISGRISMKK